MKSIVEVAKEVISGLWGNGAERVQRLEAAGYDASEVQRMVNAILSGEIPDEEDEDPAEDEPDALEVHIPAGTEKIVLIFD